MFYLGVAGVIALVMVPAFALPYAAKSWLMLILIAGLTASLCALSFVYYLPILTKPLEAFFPGIFAVFGGFAGIGIGFGTLTRGVILFPRSWGARRRGADHKLGHWADAGRNLFGPMDYDLKC